MKEIIAYFNNVPDSHRVLLFTCTLFLIWNIENLRPLQKDYKKWNHAFYNVLFLLIVTPVQYAMGFGLNAVLKYTAAHQLGLLNLSIFSNSPFLLFITGFVLLDLGEYIYHYIMHTTRRLWLFHAVHHMEEKVDVSTTLREHPMETFVRLCFLMLWIVLLGVPIWALVFRQFFQIVSNLFSHSNFRFSTKANNIIGQVFITPNLHHIHHHYEQPYTDSNFGDVLSIWDRMFGTFNIKPMKVVYGVDIFSEEEKKGFKHVILMPFKKDRFAKSKMTVGGKLKN